MCRSAGTFGIINYIAFHGLKSVASIFKRSYGTLSNVYLIVKEPLARNIL
ncbi:hypothetical protein [Flavobacterium sp.]